MRLSPWLEPWLGIIEEWKGVAWVEVRAKCDVPTTREGGNLHIALVPHRQSCWGFGARFGWCISMAIPLRIVWARLHMVNALFFSQLTNVCVDKWSTVVWYDPPRDAKLADDIVADKVGYSGLSSSSKGYPLDLFGVVFCCHKDPYMIFRKQVNWTNEVEGPSAKGPWSG